MPALEDLLVVRLFVGMLIGLTLGSFTTMLAHRLPRRLSIVTPRSHCPLCQTTLGVPDLVPVFSWVFLRGRCRHCQAKIPARYPIIEIITTLLISIAFGVIGFDMVLIPISLAIIACVTVGVIAIERT